MENKAYNEMLMATNFFAINDFKKTENGNMKVSGLLTIFDNLTSNGNGLVYHAGCYDDFCKNYYQQNGKSIPLDLLHNTTDINHIAGKVTEFIVTNNEVRIVAEISKHAPLFENIVGMVEDGVLQGFSDMSYIDNGYFDNETELFHVNKCSIVSIALVPTPAVAKSQLALNSTKFTFGSENEKKENDIKEEAEKRSVFFGL
jgi:hypothetical protein